MDFLTTILGYPSVVFTVALAVALAYWLLVIVGALGIEILDLDGATEGATEGLAHGVAEGVTEGVAHGVTEGLADGVAEAATHGAVEAAAHGAGAGLLAFFGVGRVPVTIILSVLFLSGWILTILGSRGLAVIGLGGGWLFSTLLLGASIVVGAFFTAYAVRPLAPLFVVDRAVTHAELVGRVVTVLTGRVDERFGQATLIEAGADLILQVRCPAPNSLRRDAKAVLVAYDREHGTFDVEVYDEGGAA